MLSNSSVPDNCWSHTPSGASSCDVKAGEQSSSTSPSSSSSTGKQHAHVVLLLMLCLLLPACARDVVLKPATTSFVADTRIAMQEVAKRYDDAIDEMNEQNVAFLVHNPECGLNLVMRTRTPRADAYLRSPEAVAAEKRLAAQERRPIQPVKPGMSECLSEHERVLIEDWVTRAKPAPFDEIAPRRRLMMMSRADFDLQLGLVQRMSQYVAILADAADEPDLTVPGKIENIGKIVRGVGNGVARLHDTLLRSGGQAADPGLAPLFAADGPVARFSGNAKELAGAVELIARQAKDVKTLQAAITGPQGQAVRSNLTALARDADQWSCIVFMARRGRLMTEAEVLSPRLAAMPVEDRTRVVRSYLAAQSAVPELQCGQAGAEAAAVSPIAQMLQALADAHDDLERIAKGDLTPAERRMEAAATLQRLGAVFRAIGSTAMVFI